MNDTERKEFLLATLMCVVLGEPLLLADGCRLTAEHLDALQALSFKIKKLAIDLDTFGREVLIPKTEYHCEDAGGE